MGEGTRRYWFIFAFTTVPSFSSWAKESGALAGMDLDQPGGVFAQMTSANLLPAIQSRQLSLDNICVYPAGRFRIQRKRLRCQWNA